MWTQKELAQGFKNAEIEICNGRANAGRIGECGYIMAEHMCAECGLTANLQVFLRDGEGFCGEGHYTQIDMGTVAAMRTEAIASAKAAGYVVEF